MFSESFVWNFGATHTCSCSIARSYLAMLPGHLLAVFWFIPLCLHCFHSIHICCILIYRLLCWAHDLIYRFVSQNLCPCGMWKSFCCGRHILTCYRIIRRLYLVFPTAPLYLITKTCTKYVCYLRNPTETAMWCYSRCKWHHTYGIMLILRPAVVWLLYINFAQTSNNVHVALSPWLLSMAVVMVQSELQGYGLPVLARQKQRKQQWRAWQDAHNTKSRETQSTPSTKTPNLEQPNVWNLKGCRSLFWCPYNKDPPI